MRNPIRYSFLGGLLALAAGSAAASASAAFPVVTSDLAASASMACTEALAQRTVAVSTAGHQLGAAQGAAEGDILEMESSVMSSHREIAGAVGAATGGAVFKAKGLPSLEKADVEALLGLCQRMKVELTGEQGLAQRLLKEAEAGLFKAHLAPNASLAKQTLTLEQFVLIKSAREYPAHSKFEPLLSTLMPVEALENALDQQTGKLNVQ